jgi:hypothetical protein
MRGTGQNCPECRHFLRRLGPPPLSSEEIVGRSGRLFRRLSESFVTFSQTFARLSQIFARFGEKFVRLRKILRRNPRKKNLRKNSSEHFCKSYEDFCKPYELFSQPYEPFSETCEAFPQPYEGLSRSCEGPAQGYEAFLRTSVLKPAFSPPHSQSCEAMRDFHASPSRPSADWLPPFSATSSRSELLRLSVEFTPRLGQCPQLTCHWIPPAAGKHSAEIVIARRRSSADNLKGPSPRA